VCVCVCVCVLERGWCWPLPLLLIDRAHALDCNVIFNTMIGNQGTEQHLLIFNNPHLCTESTLLVTACLSTIHAYKMLYNQKSVKAISATVLACLVEFGKSMATHPAAAWTNGTNSAAVMSFIVGPCGLQGRPDVTNSSDTGPSGQVRHDPQSARQPRVRWQSWLSTAAASTSATHNTPKSGSPCCHCC